MKHNLIDNIMMFKVLLINLGIVSFVTVANIEIWLKIVSLIIAISYTSYKFITDYKDRNARKRQ